jgi:hypothetical protein
VHPVEQFWDHLRSLDRYPEGVVPVHVCIGGTAFFSGGAGLCRANADTSLPQFPYGGVMFVGHNLDSETTFTARVRSNRPNGDPNRPMATWRNLYRVLRRAEVDLAECFFTNVYVGLLGGKRAVGKFPGANDARFTEWCRDFLRQQIEMMRPRAIVFLGVHAREFYGLEEGGPRQGRVAGHETEVLCIGHPSLAHLTWRNFMFGPLIGEDAVVAALRQAVRMSKCKRAIHPDFGGQPGVGCLPIRGRPR